MGEIGVKQCTVAPNVDGFVLEDIGTFIVDTHGIDGDFRVAVGNLELKLEPAIFANISISVGLCVGIGVCAAISLPKDGSVVDIEGEGSA